MIDKAEHLEKNQIVNGGSFYTPARFVEIAAQWLKEERFDSSYTVADTSCGYGAFFRLRSHFPKNRYVGNDVDPVAARVARKNYPFAEIFNKSALSGIGRAMFRLGTEKLCVVGNPPYNDVTSQIGRPIKTARHETDEAVRSRDLGISFLKSYAALAADLVLILHPLSYLIKKANFTSAKRFFDRYALRRSLVFSSHEFADTSRSGEFPIVMALYAASPGGRLTYEEVRNHPFRTLEGDAFRLADFDYVADHIRKYPGRDRYTPEILFYTLRDVNALRRCHTFITERCAGAVDVAPDKLAYYCYIDLFKEYARAPYWMGNFDVPFRRKSFSRYAADITALSKSRHPEVFGAQPPIPPETERRVIAYIRSVLKRPKEKNARPCHGVRSISAPTSPPKKNPST